MKRLLPALAVLASLAALARQPRFLGPPVKKPAPDAGVVAGKALLNVGDDAPLAGGVLYNPEAAGQRVARLSDWAGRGARDPARAIVVTFFSVFREGNQRDLAAFQTLYTEYRSRGVRVVAFAIDEDSSAEPVLRELLAKHQITFPVVNDRSRLAARGYLGDQIIVPTVFLLDGSGKVLFVQQGYEDGADALRGELEKQLAK